MSLGAKIQHIFPLIGLAATTTIVTTSVTHYLLSRPWCIDFEMNGEQTILYGVASCGDRSPQPTSPHTMSNISTHQW